ncbi:MAG: histidine kinase [Bacillota bacterium]|nr:histidine kinase [Bacillota bacterium]
MRLEAFLGKWFKVILIVALFIGIIVVTKNFHVEYREVNEYVTSDVVYADGRTVHFEDKNFGEINKNDVVTLHLNIPEQPLIPNASLVFYDFHAVTEVWCGDSLLDSYGEELAAKDMMIGNHDFCIDIPDDAWGGEITIILRATENRAFSNFTNLKIYPTEGAYRYYMDNDPLGFVIALALFVFGLVGLLTCALGRIRGAVLVNGIYLSLAILLISLWMISNKGIYNLFGFTAYFWQPLEYICGYTIVIPILLFFRGFIRDESGWRRVFEIAAVVEASFFTIVTVLNFTNILHYSAFMGPAYTLMIISGILLIAYTMLTKSDGSRKKSLLRTGMYIFVLTCLYEVFIRSLYQLLPLPILHNLPSMAPVGILFLLLCMVGALIADVNEMRKELENSRIKAMIAQMQPHFLYNALSSIRAMIKIEPNYAYDLMHDFTVHLRCSIQALSSDSPIPFKDELKNVKAYLNIEYMRFGDRLKVDYEIGCDDFKIIPLAVQPLVENSVKHGIHPKGEEGGRVVLRTSQTDTHYIIEVEDDGVGFNVAEVMHYTGDSVGLRNLIFRMKSLMNSDVVIDSKLNEGTRVTIKIPKKERRT